MNSNEDCLRLYPLDSAGKQQVKVFGSPPLYEPPDYLMLSVRQ
jgi:CRISPR-associated protein Cas2